MGWLIGPTSPLQNLHFHWFTFTETGMRQLLNSFVCNHSLTTLQMSEYKLDADASQLFIDFVQTRCHPQTPGGYGISKLRLTQCSMGNQNLGVATAIMLMDSTLQELHLGAKWGKYKDCIRFFGALVNNAASIRLPFLKLGLLNKKKMDVLAQYLPTCLHLQALVVTVQSHLRELCCSARHCSSLTLAELWYGKWLTNSTFKEWHFPFYAMVKPMSTATTIETRFVKSSCDRNRNLPLILAVTSSTGEVLDNDDGATNLIDVALFPSLFHVARQAPHNHSPEHVDWALGHACCGMT
jgi:hypothetical protein